MEKMSDLKIYNMGGSCCSQRLIQYNGKLCFVKEIKKNIQGVENGFDKFYYEIQHMMKYSGTGLFPQIYQVDDTKEAYSVIMEYCYNGMTLSDLIRNESADMLCFKKSFNFIMTDLISKLYSKHYDISPPEDYLKQCYYNRVTKRLDLILESDMLTQYGFSKKLYKMMKYGCFINGDFYPPVFKYMEFMEQNEYLKAMLGIQFSCHAHYDLCPMNILVGYDFETNQIKDYKLIDVRGENDTGIGKRHYMYDMGKMLLGLDAFDPFRIFNGRNDKASYLFEADEKENDIYINFKFSKGTIVGRFKEAQEYFWNFFENHFYFEDVLQDSASNLKVKFLFSQCMMYHPDIPCRIIYEKNEELALLVYMRGHIMIRYFLESIFGKDPVGKFNKKVNIWEGL